MNISRSHAGLAAQLLRGAADYVRSMKVTKPDRADALESDARSYELIADRVEAEPRGEAPDIPPPSQFGH